MSFKNADGMVDSICHYFWYTLGEPDGAHLEMRSLNLYSMRSAVKHLPVYLWGYQTFTNLPSGVVFKDANELLPYAKNK